MTTAAASLGALAPFRLIGRPALRGVRQAGAIALFGLRGLAAALTPPLYLSQLWRQMFAIGFLSLPVTGLTAVFTGAALALNIYSGGGRLNAEQVMPQIVALGITRELGPVLAGLMLSGRVAAAIAAEIGAMRTTEQIDAMVTLSTDPYRYLVAPRLTAAVVALPLLTAIADLIGVAGGWLVAARVLGFNPVVYVRNTDDLPAGRGRGVRADQGGRVRFHRGADGLLPRLQRGRRRPRRRPGDDPCGGLLRHPHPRLRLPADHPVHPHMTVMAKLEWRGVRKSFGGRPVLDDLDLGVAPGRSLVIMGGSGQGKSVTVKLAMGLLTPDAGEIRLDGANIASVTGSARRRAFAGIGVLFQGAALFDSLSVWENVAFRLINADRAPRRKARARAMEALSRVRLPADVADAYPASLSGGMQKRVGLARAIVGRPSLLFFDEPTSGLDPVTAAVINELIVEQVRDLGCTAVTITHDVASARKIADEIAMLHGGRIIWRGSPSELDLASDPYVRQFVEGRSDEASSERTLSASRA